MSQTLRAQTVVTLARSKCSPAAADSNPDADSNRDANTDRDSVTNCDAGSKSLREYLDPSACRDRR